MTAIPVSSSRTDPVIYHLITFGCQMNARDSQWLGACLDKLGFVCGPAEAADIIILNTCSVREKPEQKVIQTIRACKSLRSDAKFVILGCVAQQYGDKLFELNENIVCVAGGDHIAQIPALLLRLMREPQKPFSLVKFQDTYEEPAIVPERVFAAGAFVNIMKGCDKFCAYCIVPYTRGRQRSRQAEDILAECRRRLVSGAKELTLLGQNVTAWGKDLGYTGGFAQLLYKIAELPGLERLRFITSHPADITDRIINVFGVLKVLCPWIHLPLQAGSDKILAAMNRGYNLQTYMQIVDKLKNVRPDIAIATDLIVGFPGETEADFQKTLSAMREVGFSSSYSFCYSDRPGTQAANMPNKLSKDEKQERLQRLQALQSELTSQWLADKVGQPDEILIEKRSSRGPENCWMGRDIWNDVVNVDFKDNVPESGDIRRVFITHAKKHTLAGRPM